MLRRTCLLIAAALPVLTLSSCGSSAGDGSDSVSLRFADVVPKSHFLSQDFVQYWIKQVERRASEQGKSIRVEYFADGQLGEAADQVDNLNNGLFDAGLVASPYDPSHLPLSDAFNLPFMGGNAGELTKAYYQVLQDTGSAIYKRDFKDNGLVPIAAFGYPTYQIAMSRIIDGPEEIDGRKLRSAGGVQNETIQALGGTPVSLTTPEQYEGLQRGIIDGGIFNLPSLIDNKTAEVLQSFTTNVNMGSFNGAMVISEESWNSLPSWAQRISREAGSATVSHFSESMVELNDAARAKLAEDFNLTAVTVSDAQLDALEAKLQPVEKAWVKLIGKRNADGEAALGEAKQSIAAQR